MSGEKPEAAQRVGDRMGTKGPSRGREQVLRSQKGLSGNKCECVWREALETDKYQQPDFLL